MIKFTTILFWFNYCICVLIFLGFIMLYAWAATLGGK